MCKFDSPVDESYRTNQPVLAMRETTRGAGIHTDRESHTFYRNNVAEFDQADRGQPLPYTYTDQYRTIPQPATLE